MFADDKNFTYQPITKSQKILALLLAITLFISLSVAPVFASVDSHRQKANDALKAAQNEEDRAAALALEISALDGKAEEFRNKAASYEPQIEEAVAKTDSIERELDELQATKVQLVSEIASTTAEYEAKKETLSDRASESYRNGEASIFLLIFDAESITDFLARSEIVGRILQQNAEITTSLRITQRKLENDKTKLEGVVKQTEEKQSEAQQIEANLKGLRANMQNAAAQVDAIESQKTSLMNDSIENAERLRAVAQQEEATARGLEARLAELARKQAQAQSKDSTSTSTPVVVSKGGFAWPTPGFSRVTSPYGMRMHPVLGYNRMHNGIDIGRNGGQSIDGASIVASKSGRVITAGYLNGYGNTVIIDHGGGYATVYAHQQAGGIKVSVGQDVKQGQRIGTVGSTGYSTGPHLHFEVRVNGVAQNPMSYL